MSASPCYLHSTLTPVLLHTHPPTTPSLTLAMMSVMVCLGAASLPPPLRPPGGPYAQYNTKITKQTKQNKQNNNKQ